MTRTWAAALTLFGAVLVLLGMATPSAAGAAQVPPSTSTTVVAAPSSVLAATPASVVETPAPPASTVPRAASGFVDLQKPAGETWELRQVLTILGLGIVGDVHKVLPKLIEALQSR